MMAIRELLFGDLPIERWAAVGTRADSSEPWALFARAKKAIEEHATSAAIDTLMEITRKPGLEALHYLEAWTALRALGVSPAAPEKTKVYGIVLELNLAGGLDVVACYADHRARYINHGGGGVVWEVPDDPSISAAIDRALRAADAIARQIGAWNGAGLPVPPPGQSRLSVLTPAGTRLGQGTIEVLKKDRLTGPAMSATGDVMMDLIKKGLSRPTR